LETLKKVCFADGTKKMNRDLVKKVAVVSAVVKAVVFHVVVAVVVYFTFNTSSFQDHWGSSLVYR
jgi:hypothetical protein